MCIIHQLQVEDKLFITDHGSWDSFNTSLHSEIQLSSKLRSRRELNAWSSEDDADCNKKKVHSLQPELNVKCNSSIVYKEMFYNIEHYRYGRYHVSHQMQLLKCR